MEPKFKKEVRPDGTEVVTLVKEPEANKESKTPEKGKKQ